MDQNIMIIIAILCFGYLITPICISFITIKSLNKKQNESKSVIDMNTFAGLLEILNAMIDLELGIYESNIFTERGGLTNANFANFHEDICYSIEQHLSPIFMEMITQYYTEEYVYTIISNKVKRYLASKV